MLSWHEGFGLTGWEAIAARVPLIVSKQSGLFRLVNETLGDLGVALLSSLNIQGYEGDDETANHTEQDEVNVQSAILEIASDIERYQKNASNLKTLLEQELVCTWCHTAKQFCDALEIVPDSIPLSSADDFEANIVEQQVEPTEPLSSRMESKLIQTLHRPWPDIPGVEMPDSYMLLPASEVVPFHSYRLELLQKMIAWAISDGPAIKLHLLAGAGGTGKTRLLTEVCRRLKRDHNWQAGFLQPVDQVDQELNVLLQTDSNCLRPSKTAHRPCPLFGPPCPSPKPSNLGHSNVI